MRHLYSRLFFIWFFSFSVLIGSGYNVYLSYERFYNPDSETYMNIAKGNFDNQSLIRRYRVIVPAIANLAAMPLRPVYYKIVSDKRDKYDWPLLTGFFLVNSVLMSFAAVVIFKIMEEYQLSGLAKIIGLAAFLTGGRWSGFITAHPVTDSLTILSISLMTFSIITKRKRLLCTAIVVGLLSKESFALFFPLILLFCGRSLLPASLLSMAVAFASYFAIKYCIDHVAVTAAGASIAEDLQALDTLSEAFKKLFSVKGVADVFSVYGFFNLFFISGLFYRTFRKNIRPAFDGLFITFCLLIVVHMVLSLELARMFFLGSAMFVPFMAKCFDAHPFFNRFR